MLMRNALSRIRIARQKRRVFSSSVVPPEAQAAAAPLVLQWKNEENNASTNSLRPPILFPFALPSGDNNEDDYVFTVSSVDEALEKIHEHYSNENHFVGGMGENDPGVALTTSLAPHSGDLLDSPEPILQLMDLVKQERHGVPFHLCTTGIVNKNGTAASVDWETSGWSQAPGLLHSWQVSLYAASPPAYAKETGGAPASAFLQASQFIMEASERGMAVEAAVVPSQAAAGRDMALSLGARLVHVVAAASKKEEEEER